MSLSAWLTPERLRMLAFITAAITLLAMASQVIGAQSLVLPNGQPVFGDYIAFWSAGRLALEGHASLVYSEEAIKVAHLEALPTLDGLIFVWRHPPPFLLIATPLSVLPFPYSAIVFFLASAAVFLYAALKFEPRRDYLIFAAAMPAALLHVGSVQMGLLVAGITGLALAWQRERPIAAGVMVGLLVIKPHMAVLWPLYLAVRREWTMFAAAAATAVLACLLAGLVFGFELYGGFLAALAEGQDTVTNGLIEFDTLTSLYANLVGLRIPSSIAIVVHWASAILAIWLALLIWRKGDWGLSAAAFACATLLFSPYLFFYDETLMLIAIAVLHRGATTRDAAWLAFAWASAALSLSAGKVLTLPICPITAWAVLLIAARRSGITLAGIWAKRPAPEPRM